MEDLGAAGVLEAAHSTLVILSADEVFGARRGEFTVAGPVIIVRLRHLKHVLGASVEVENCKRIGLRNLVRVVGDELSEIEMM